MANIEVLRGVIVGRGGISPPRSAAVTCEEGSAGTVVLELGKGAVGRVFEVGEQQEVTGYMTKQQKEEKAEGEEDPNPSTEPQ
jgi:hypothetical protein